jgi:hypothetical protein
MFFLYDINGNVQDFLTVRELKEYIEMRHAEKGGFDWISEIKDDEGKLYGCNWNLGIEPIG